MDKRYIVNYELPITNCGFTLIELIIAIAISAIITIAIYFTLNTTLDSWGNSRDQLALQKVFSEVMNEVLDGTTATYGIKDSLEIIWADSDRIEFVPPWVDDTHSVKSKGAVYTLNCKIKPGAAVPIGEAKLPGSNEYLLVPVKMLESEDAAVSEILLGISSVPIGAILRFTYHPDATSNPAVINSIWWDAEDKQVYSEDENGVKSISQNAFGVTITNFKLRYYDNANNLITEYESVERRDLNMITGVELYMEAQMGEYKQTLIGFASLRNAPMRSGYLTLREGTQIPIPDSHCIHTLLLTNITGVTNGDELQLEITPKSGKTWRLTIKFVKSGLSKPQVESYTIEYPIASPVYTEYPRTSVDLGLNLLTLGTDGLYDYDDDQYIDDFVILEGDVILEVKKMDIEGAGLFIRP